MQLSINTQKKAIMNKEQIQTYPLLSQIETPKDLKKLPIEKLPNICFEIREYIINTLSEIGGHFASNLGVVELTVALHYVYDTPIDKLIWDVGHQIYPHKILTGRREKLKTVRKFGGLSGFPKREESIYDLYNTGHAGTSISQVLGEAIARDCLGLDHKCVCVIGDASIASGMALEALNHGGHTNTDCLVVLNDNDMSISHNVGALNKYFNRLVSNPVFTKWKRWWYTFLLLLPLIGSTLRIFSKKLEHAFKDIITPGGFFVNLGFRYIGPVDGHNVLELVQVLQKIRKVKTPTLLHVYTQKGAGYTPAEKNPIKYHSVSVFNKDDGSFTAHTDKNEIAFSNIVGETLLELARKNPKIVAITPAMIEGSGLRPLYNAMPERVYDVGIAEQHAVTFSGALAAAGMIPYLCIYSTFLNRGLDQLIQDIALMNFPVRIIVDRAGCVGPDGETHQGLYDIGLLLSIPNIQVFACANGAELKAMLEFMENYSASPIAIRFPKASCLRKDLESPLLQNTIKNYDAIIQKEDEGNADLAILAVGIMWETALELKEKLQFSHGLKVTLIGIRWIRPINLQQLISELENVKNFIILEDSYIHSSAAAYLLQNLTSEIIAKHLQTFAFPERLIEHGSREEIMNEYGLSSQAIYNNLKKLFDIRLNKSI